jgi:hypothetical protein
MSRGWRGRLRLRLSLKTKSSKLIELMRSMMHAVLCLLEVEGMQCKNSRTYENV